jgi:hypothetical protein
VERSERVGVQYWYDDTSLFGLSPLSGREPRSFHPEDSARTYHGSHYLVSNYAQAHNFATQVPAGRPPQSAHSPDLWNDASRGLGFAPPSYDESVADLPPDYTPTDAPVYARTPNYTPFPSLNASICSNVPNCLRLSRDTSPSSSLFLDEKSLYADVDFGFSEEGVRSHAKKSKKAAAKKPAISNALDDGDKKPDEAPAGGDGGGDPPADGGAGSGDGGDGGDDKKGKKKSKKEAEEEERKKKEEEERLAKEEEERLAKEEEERLAKEAEEEAERKKKEEEEAEAAAKAEADAKAANSLSWADPTQGGDDWGSFAATAPTGKKKKGKKGKVRHLGYVMTYTRALTLA